VKSTYTITQAQRKLPGLLREVNEGASVYGITVHDDVKGYLIGKERMDSLMETLEVLSNPDAAAALREYEAGRTEFLSAEALDE